VGLHRKQLRAPCENSRLSAGKAPRSVIEKRFRKEIQEELTKKLVSKSYHDAIEQEQLRVASLVTSKMSNSVRTIDALPRDRGHHAGVRPAGIQKHSCAVAETNVSDAEVDTALERLRDQSADFVDAPERGLQMGDFAVIDFEGSIDGKPVSEIASQASKNLHGGKKFWLHLAPDNFLPAFCEQMTGEKRDETRKVSVAFPSDFPVKELAPKRQTI